MEGAVTSSGAAATRERLVTVAVDLFTRHSFAGTSLQMIADELGFTKAAIYYHFRTREELLDAVLEPIVSQLRDIVAQAEELRGTHTRAEHMLTGYVSLAVHNRPLVSVLAGDPSVVKVLQSQPEWRELIDRQLALLADVTPGSAGIVKATVVFGGIAGSVGPTWIDIEDDVLREHLVEAGRRTLGLRTPRRS